MQTQVGSADERRSCWCFPSLTLSYPSVEEGAAACAYSNKLGDCSRLKLTAVFMPNPCSGWPCGCISVCLQYQEGCENMWPKVRGGQGLLLSVAVLI